MVNLLGAHQAPGMSYSRGAKAHDLRDRAAKYLDDACAASESSIHRRLIDIAQHYQMLAAAEARDADRLGNERRQKSKSPKNGSCGGKTEIEILRLKLRMFASQQTDQTVRLQCLAVD